MSIDIYNISPYYYSYPGYVIFNNSVKHAVNDIINDRTNDMIAINNLINAFSD